MRRIAAIVLCCATAFAVAGCMNPVSLDANDYVIMIGVDEGENRQYCISFLIQREGLAGGGRTEELAVVLAAEGEGIYEAIETVQAVSAHLLSFTRTNSIAVARNVAEAGLLSGFLGFDFDALKLRDAVDIIVTEESAMDYLKAVRESADVNIAKLQQSLIEQHETAGTVAYATASARFEHALRGTGDLPLAFAYVNAGIASEQDEADDETAPGGEAAEEAAEYAGGGPAGGDGDLLRGTVVHGSSPVTTAGAALFDGERMTGVLTPEETQYLLLGSGSRKLRRLTIPGVGGGNDEVEIERMSAYGVTITLAEAPVISVRIALRVSALDAAGGHSQSTELWAESIARELNAVFAKAQRANSDAFCFGRYAVLQFKSGDAWREFDWKARYSNAEVRFDIELEVVE
ncbi:MAG: Ger(x)C family spore germination C-terminal domain-containing protein [Clostridia bacterium]|nr:Ger(x)C family spore germination C-terminal domain-containing protein [Clostridia bacterium]